MEEATGNVQLEKWNGDMNEKSEWVVEVDRRRMVWELLAGQSMEYDKTGRRK